MIGDSIACIFKFKQIAWWEVIIIGTTLLKEMKINPLSAAIYLLKMASCYLHCLQATWHLDIKSSELCQLYTFGENNRGPTGVILQDNGNRTEY